MGYWSQCIRTSLEKVKEMIPVPHQREFSCCHRIQEFELTNGAKIQYIGDREPGMPPHPNCDFPVWIVRGTANNVPKAVKELDQTPMVMGGAPIVGKVSELIELVEKATPEELYAAANSLNSIGNSAIRDDFLGEKHVFQGAVMNYLRNREKLNRAGVQ